MDRNLQQRIIYSSIYLTASDFLIFWSLEVHIFLLIEFSSFVRDIAQTKFLSNRIKANDTIVDIHSTCILTQSYLASFQESAGQSYALQVHDTSSLAGGATCKNSV